MATLRTAARLPRPSSSSSSTRCIASYSHAKAQVQSISRPLAPTAAPDLVAQAAVRRAAAEGALSPTCFEATEATYLPLSSGGKEPVDPNKAKLGKSTSHLVPQISYASAKQPPALRILQDRLPTLLQSPLPQHILAPNIALHLFPSTHPHLPTVSGRVAYNAALWTSPIAWNRVPIIGNVRLEILAERMTSEPLTFLPRRAGAMPEQLVVRWCEKRKCPKEAAGEGAGAAIARSLRLSRGGVDPKAAFTGLFIFDFDGEGRILTHTIETAQEGGNWERGVGAKFVGLTDWLLGGIRDPGDTPPMPMFARRRR